MTAWTKLVSAPRTQSRRRIASVLGMLLATGVTPVVAKDLAGNGLMYPDCNKNADCPVGERCYSKKNKKNKKSGSRAQGECREKNHNHMTS